MATKGRAVPGLSLAVLWLSLAAGQGQAAGQAVREPRAASPAGSTRSAGSDKAELRLVPLSGPPLELGAVDLEKMPHQTLRVSYPAGPEHRMSQAEMSGVPLRALLDRMGVPAGHDIRGEALRLYVVAEGADGYRAVLALAELDPDLAGQAGQIVLVADRRGGQALDAAEGPLRLVVPMDKRPARWVRQLVRITVLRAP